MKNSIFLALGVLLCSLLSVSCSSSKEGTEPGDTRQPDGVIDRPANNAVLHGAELFGGWAAQPSGIQSVAIYADGQFVTNALLGVDRPDVVKARPEYRPAMVAGWDILVDTSHLTTGPHVFTAKIKSKSGVEKDLTVRASVAQ